MEEAAQPLAVDICSCISILPVTVACSRARGDDLHMGMVNKQATSWTVPRALKTGVAEPPFVISQSNALKVRAKLKTFLKMIKHVKPSMAKSPDVVSAEICTTLQETIARRITYGTHPRCTRSLPRHQ